MKKSVSKRIKITKKGKILRRAMGIGHFRAKKSASAMKRKKGYRSLEGNKNIKKVIK
ncbi:50S ribosomal protein L35 [Candidatus Wolfebacteria bacterium]|nr:50S ribosomal protein L35 [Candidatus Wolfebacteria bacterium]